MAVASTSRRVNEDQLGSGFLLLGHGTGAALRGSHLLVTLLILAIALLLGLLLRRAFQQQGELRTALLGPGETLDALDAVELARRQVHQAGAGLGRFIALLLVLLRLVEFGARGLDGEGQIAAVGAEGRRRTAWRSPFLAISQAAHHELAVALLADQGIGGPAPVTAQRGALDAAPAGVVGMRDGRLGGRRCEGRGARQRQDEESDSEAHARRAKAAVLGKAAL